MLKRFLTSAMIVALLAGATTGIAAAQPDPACTDIDGYQICGAYQDYWERNAGPAFLGNPASNEFTELRFDTGGSVGVQYFERYRLESHAENAGGEYDMLLGRLGDEVLQAQGHDWHAFTKDDPAAPNYMGLTGFAIAPEFIDFWSGNGVDLGDDGVSFRESVMLFGYPISPAQAVTAASGAAVLTQWFERARFELQDGQVRLADLGSELLAVPGVDDPQTAAELAQVRRSVAPYQQLERAQANGWNLVDGLDHCFNNPGVGAMGVHYINVDMLDTETDPLAPEAMVYQHGSDGELNFGAVEWIVPADAWDAENPDSLPSVLGRDLHLNEALGVYVMHAWIFFGNPAGVFEDWNPDVSCPEDEQEGSEGDEGSLDIDTLRDAIAPYQDVETAMTDGYQLVDGLDHCFNNPGVGAMGVHYINVDLLDTTVDPLQPEAMVYQHGANGELSLGAVEWIVPADAWDEEGNDGLPSVADHEMHLNAELGVYVLHAWIFLENPAGMFEDWHPDVTCPDEGG